MLLSRGSAPSLVPTGGGKSTPTISLAVSSKPRRWNSTEIVIHFPHDMVQPKNVRIGLMVRRAPNFTRAPPRCFRCQKYGHTAAHCASSEQKCSICSGPHEWKALTPGATPKCANCDERHAATTPNCSKRIEAIKQAREFALGLIPHRNKAKGHRTVSKVISTTMRSVQEYPLSHPCKWRQALRRLLMLRGKSMD